MDRGQEQKSGRRGGEQQEDAESSDGWYQLGPVVEPATTESDVIDVPADTASSATLPEHVDTSSGTQQENVPSATATKNSEAAMSPGKQSSRSSFPGGRTLEMDFKIKDRVAPQSVTITLRLEPDPSRSENALDKDTSHYPRHRSLAMEILEDSESTTFTGTFPIDPFDDIPSSKRSIGLDKRKTAESAWQTNKMEEGIPEDDEDQTQSEDVSVANKESAIPSAENVKDHQRLLPRLTELVRNTFQKHTSAQPQEDTGSRAEQTPMRKDQAVSVQDIWPVVTSEVQVGASLYRIPSVAQITNEKHLISDTPKNAPEAIHILRKDAKPVKNFSASDGLKTVSWASYEPHNKSSDTSSFSDAKTCRPDKSDPHATSEDTYVSVVSSPEDTQPVQGITMESVNRNKSKNAPPQKQKRMGEKKSYRMLSVNKYSPSAPPLSHESLRKDVPRSQTRLKGEGLDDSASGETDTDNSQDGSGIHTSPEILSQERSSDTNLPQESPGKKKPAASPTGELSRNQSRATLDVETDPLVGSIFGELDTKHSHAARSTRSEEEEIEMDSDDLTSRGVQSNASSALSTAVTSSTLSNEPEVRDIEPDISESKGEMSPSADEDDMLDSMTTLISESESDVSEDQVKYQDPHRKNDISSGSHVLKQSERPTMTSQRSAATKDQASQTKLRSETTGKPEVIHFLSPNTPLPHSRSLSEKSQVDNEEVHLVPSGTGRTGGLPVTTVFSVPAVLSNPLSIRSNTRTDFEKKRFVDDASFIHKTSTLKDTDGTDSTINDFDSASSSGRNLSYRLITKSNAVSPSQDSVLRMNVFETAQKSTSKRELTEQTEANEVITVPGVVIVGGAQSDALEDKTTPGIYEKRLNLEKLDIVQDSKVNDLEQTSLEPTVDTLGLQNVEVEKTSSKVDLLKQESLVMQKESGLIDKRSHATVSASSRITIGSSFDGESFIPVKTGEWSDSPDNESTVTHVPSTEQGPESYIDELFDFFLSESGNTLKVKMPSSLSGSEIKKYLSQPQREDTQEVSPGIKAQLDVSKLMPEFDMKEYRKVDFEPKPFVVQIPSTSQSREEGGKIERKSERSFLKDTLNILKSPLFVMRTSTSSSQNVFQDTSARETESANEVINSPEGRPSSHSSDNERSQELVPETNAQENTLHSHTSGTFPYSIQEVTAYATVMPRSVSFKTEDQPERLIRPESESGKTAEDHDSAADSSVSSRESAGVVHIIHSTLDAIYRSQRDSGSSIEEMSDPQIVGTAVDIPKQQQVNGTQTEVQKLQDDCREGLGLHEKDRTQLLSQDRDQQGSSLEADIPHESVPNLELQEDRPVLSRTELIEKGKVQGLTNPAPVEKTSGNERVTDRSVVTGVNQEQTLLSNISSLPKVDLQTEQSPQNTPSSNNDTQTVPIGENNFGASLSVPLRENAEILQSDNVQQISKVDVATECGHSLQDIIPAEPVLEPVSDNASAVSPTSNSSVHSIPESAFQSLTSDLTFCSSSSAPADTANIGELVAKELMEEAPRAHDDASAGNEEGQHPPRLLVPHTEQHSALHGEDTTQVTPRSMPMNLPSNNDLGEREKTSEIREDNTRISVSSDKEVHSEGNTTADLDTRYIISSKFDVGPVGNVDKVSSMTPEQTRSAEKQVDIDRPCPTEQSTMPFKIEPIVVSRFQKKKAANASDNKIRENSSFMRRRMWPNAGQTGNQGVGRGSSEETLEDAEVGQQAEDDAVTRGAAPVEDERRDSSNDNFDDAEAMEAMEISATDAGGRADTEKPTIVVKSQGSPVADQRRGSSNENFKDAKFEQDWAMDAARRSGTQEPTREVQGQKSPVEVQTHESSDDSFQDATAMQNTVTGAGGRTGTEEPSAEVQIQESPLAHQRRGSSNENFKDAKFEQDWALDAARKSGTDEPSREVQSQGSPVIFRRCEPPKDKVAGRSGTEEPTTVIKSQESPVADQRRASSNENYKDAKFEQDRAIDAARITRSEEPTAVVQRPELPVIFRRCERPYGKVSGRSGTEEPTPEFQICGYSKVNRKNAQTDQYWESNITEIRSSEEFTTDHQRLVEELMDSRERGNEDEMDHVSKEVVTCYWGESETDKGSTEDEKSPTDISTTTYPTTDDERIQSDTSKEDEVTSAMVRTTAVKREETEVRSPTANKDATPVPAESPRYGEGGGVAGGSTNDADATPTPAEPPRYDGGGGVAGGSTNDADAPPIHAESPRYDSGGGVAGVSRNDEATTSVVKDTTKVTVGVKSSDVSAADDDRESDTTEDKRAQDIDEFARGMLEERLSTAEGPRAVSAAAERADQQVISGERGRPPPGHEDDFELRTILINLGRIFGPTIDESVLELVIILKELWDNRPRTTHPTRKGKKK